MKRIGFVIAALAGAMIATIAAGRGDPTMVPLAGNHPIEAERNAAVGDADPDRMLAMEIRSALRNRARLERLLVDLHRPSAPDYHRWLKPGEFEQRFGARSADIAAVTKWLRDEGFAIEATGEGYIRFEGTVAQAEHAFAVKIRKFGDGSLFGHTDDPLVPREFAGIIGAVLGMDNLVGVQPATSNLPRKLAMIGGEEAFGPSDLWTFYDETPLLSDPANTGSGECIAIVGLSDFLPGAVTAFNSQFGLPASNITTVLADGSDPGKNSDESETHLDLEWSHAVAPGAPTTYYLGNLSVAPGTQALIDAIARAASDDTCAVISISFTLCSPSAQFLMDTMDPQFAKAAAQGQSVFVSAGDQGAAGLVLSMTQNGCVTASSRNVNEMSADTNVSSIGGTSFDPTYDINGNDVGDAPERVWDDPNDGIALGGAGGGGPSAVFSKPSYQTGSGVPNDGARDTPDVAMIASPNFPGVFIADDNGSGGVVFEQIGGTSLSAPVWAGIAKVLDQLSGQRQGNLNPLIYQLANQNLAGNGFRDVLSGNNNFNGVTGFNAGPGYDEATGWGTVDIATFVNAAIATASATATPTATSSSSSTPTATPTSTATSTLSATPTSTMTATPAATPTRTTTPTPTPMRTQTATPTVTATPTSTSTATPTSTATATSTPTLTPTPNGARIAAPTKVKMPAVGIGTGASSRANLVIRNAGKPGDLIGNISLTNNQPGAAFTMNSSGPFAIASGGKLIETITFTPDATFDGATITITSNDQTRSVLTIPVSGAGLTGKLLAQRNLTIRSRNGVPASANLPVKNTGKGMLTAQVSSASAPFSGGGDSIEIAPGEVARIVIGFSPTSSTSPVIGSMTIDAVAPSSGEATVTLRGIVK